MKAVGLEETIQEFNEYEGAAIIFYNSKHNVYDLYPFNSNTDMVEMAEVINESEINTVVYSKVSTNKEKITEKDIEFIA